MPTQVSVYPQLQPNTFFEKSFRVESSQSSTKHPGTGLGLAICKGIVEAHGGTITFSTTPGKGSVFRFSLPAFDPEGALHRTIEDHLSKADEEHAPLSLALCTVGSCADPLKTRGKRECSQLLEQIRGEIVNAGIRTTDVMYCSGKCDVDGGVRLPRAAVLSVPSRAFLVRLSRAEVGGNAWWRMG
ncbi:ATP-binding protein [Myxococcota bacterium]